MRSFRFKLTLWNTAVLLIVLVSFGATAAIVTERTVLGAMDRELAVAAERARDPRGVGAPFAGGAGPGPRQPMRQERFQSGPLGPRLVSPEGRVVWPEAAEPLSLEGFEQAVRIGRDHRSVTIGGASVRVASVRQDTPGGWHVVQIGRDLAETESLLAQQRAVYVLLLPAALIVAAFGGMFLVNRALKPVQDVTKAAREIEADDLSTRLDVSGDDELAELARTFNGMIERLESSFRNLEDSYEAQKRFVADASHEMRTPLSRIKLLTSSTLTQRTEEEEKTQALKAIDASASDMARLIEGLLQLARSDGSRLALARERIPLRSVIEEAVSQVDSGSRVTIGDVCSSEALGDTDAVRRVLVNLLSNSLRHTPETGKVEVHADVVGQTVAISVTDTGEGIPTEHLGRVKDRFYRVDSSRTRGSGGMGLGLAICDALAKSMGGTLEIESEVGKGTRAVLSLPMAT